VETTAPEAGAMLRLELVRGARLECRFDLTSGAATLLKDGAELAVAKATPVKGAGKWDLSFANVDQHLTVWVNGSVQEFVPVTEGGPANPAPQVAYVQSPAIPTAADLAPAGVAVQGAGAVVQHLKVWRDIYYIAASVSDQLKSLDLRSVPQDNYSLSAFLRNPAEWAAFNDQRKAEFVLGADEFFVLGDNSARSADSRLWPDRSWRSGPPYAVKRDLLIGKALFIYWPHAWETPVNWEIPMGILGRVRVPFYPNFQRMQLIR
jgi:signal peptidase I